MSICNPTSSDFTVYLTNPNANTIAINSIAIVDDPDYSISYIDTLWSTPCAIVYHAPYDPIFGPPVSSWDTNQYMKFKISGPKIPSADLPKTFRLLCDTDKGNIYVDMSIGADPMTCVQLTTETKYCPIRNDNGCLAVVGLDHLFNYISTHSAYKYEMKPGSYIFYERQFAFAKNGTQTGFVALVDVKSWQLDFETENYYRKWIPRADCQLLVQLVCTPYSPTATEGQLIGNHLDYRTTGGYWYSLNVGKYWPELDLPCGGGWGNCDDKLNLNVPGVTYKKVSDCSGLYWSSTLVLPADSFQWSDGVMQTKVTLGFVPDCSEPPTADPLP